MNTTPANKKVLIITYYWPPSGGSPVLRWLKFAKYLHEFGWSCTIYTPSNPEPQAMDYTLLSDIPENISIIKRKIFEPYGLFKFFTGRNREKGLATSFISNKKTGIISKLAVWTRGNFFIPDARKFWIKPSVKFLNKYLLENPHNLIISTGPPHSMHLIALGVKKKLKIPWISDFRDPWTNIDYYKELKLTAWANSKHHRLEKKVLAGSDAVITVSPTMSKEFSSLGANRVYTLTNGFDELPKMPEIKTDKVFSILHVGSMPASRNPVVLWKSLQKLSENTPGFKETLRIELIGNVDYTIIGSIENCKLSENVIRRSHIPHGEVLQRMCCAGVLLLVVNNTPNAKGILTNKFFEYLAAKRPIIAIGPTDGDVAEIMKEAGAGKILDFDDEASTMNYLKELYSQFTSGTLHVDVTNIDKFNRRNLTASLATLLDSIIQ